jgi:glycosyltransferase involved in cell wall biosynthesis
VVLSRNFGSFAAITAGLAHGQGPLYAVMAADLQEPPTLVREFHRRLCADECDVVVGTRVRRGDPWLGRLASALFWRLYRVFVQRAVPPGGVDIFGCTRGFRDQLLSLRERNTTLVGLVFWLGFRRGEVAYERRPRSHGRSGWTVARRVRYLLDSAFAFSDLPIRLVSLIGVLGMGLALLLGAIVLWARLRGDIPVPGYAATVLAVMFFGGLNSLGIGLLGEYLWRTFENTKGRPGYVVARHQAFGGEGA